MIVIVIPTVLRPPTSPAALLVVPPSPAHGAAAVPAPVVPALHGVLARRAALAVHLGVVHLEVDRLQERECVQVEWCAN